MQSMQKAPHESETTFRSYSAEQAKRYAAGRVTYHPRLYDVIFTYHESTGGKFGRVVDVGCGTGQATKDLAKHFDQAWGLDPSPAMRDAARDLSSEMQTKAGESINWELGTGEELDTLVEQGLLEEHGVDMITVATAVHWFDMARFWPQCARLLRPGGTVALWCYSSAVPHPSTPNYAKIKELMHDFRYGVLGPYHLKGNMLAGGLYEDLPLPWQVSPQEPAFPEDEYVRREWGRYGVLSAAEPMDGEPDVDFFSGSRVVTLEQLAAALETPSPVTRWRQANAGLADTEEDCVRVLIRRLRELLAEGGAGETIRLGTATGLLMLKRR